MQRVQQVPLSTRKPPWVAYDSAMDDTTIRLAFSPNKTGALGHIWSITAKENDFYLDTWGELKNAVHLSFHGPRINFDQHRFHVKGTSRAMKELNQDSHRVRTQLPRKGLAFNGLQVDETAFLVARIRWSWHLQRPRFFDAARSGLHPKIAAGEKGIVLQTPLLPNTAWDIDLVVSFGAPYWPNSDTSARFGARAGFLETSSGMFLSATSYGRGLSTNPTPEEIDMPLPLLDQKPTRLLSGGFGPKSIDGPFWFAESITSEELILAVQDADRDDAAATKIFR